MHSKYYEKRIKGIFYFTASLDLNKLTAISRIL